MPSIAVTVPQTRKPSRIAEERKRDLIQAAIRDIAAHGYDAVTVATICEEAGFSRGLIGHYFSGKDDLLHEAVKTVATELGAAIRSAADAAGPDPAARLHALIAASFTPPGFTPEATLYRDIWRDYRAGVGRLFARAAKDRRIKLDPDRTALTFSQLVEGLWVGWAADPEAITQQTAEDCCHTYIDMILGSTRCCGSRKSERQ
jgi:TetR/AcrR family transcriptional regulator, transcriptional repressor of bet genes